MRLEQPKWTEIGRWWPAIEQWIAEALQIGGGTMLPVDVYNALISRNMKLWLAVDGSTVKACCVTRPVIYPRVKMLDALVCGGGDMDEWLPYYPVIEGYAQAMDCDGVEFHGRKGWERKMVQFGFTSVMTIYRKMFDG